MVMYIQQQRSRRERKLGRTRARADEDRGQRDLERAREGKREQAYQAHMWPSSAKTARKSRRRPASH